MSLHLARFMPPNGKSSGEFWADCATMELVRRTALNENWEFRVVDAGPGFYQPHVQPIGWLPAFVPGHVHLDLLRNGVIADPLTKLHEHGCQWVDERDWTYRTSFTWSPNSELPLKVLRFEGLDTVCAIWLNGAQIGASDNMFVPLEIDVSAALREGANDLEIRFESAVRVGIERREKYFAKEGLAKETTFFDERAFVRKAQYMSAWDWGPRLVSCGIWKPVQLIEYSSRIIDFHVREDHLADGRVRVWSQTAIEGDAKLTTNWDGNEFDGDFDLILESPELWWPNNEGAQMLYSATAQLDSGDRIEKKVGLRTIELRREPDEFGESFEFVVNGRPIFARGANWIPNDSFPSRVTKENYWSQIETCKDLNMNMLRVWGGGLYETEDFYDACDANGILVWQDFPFACSYYPDDETACDSIRNEAEVAVTRLRDRTSLALWCGNNECQTMWEGKWGPDDHQPPRYLGKRIYSEVLPEVAARLNPETPYIPTSPIGSKSGADPDCNAGGSGDQHYWDAWHGRGDWVHYADSTARFCSEFGFASSCSMRTWAYALEGEPIDSPTHPIVRSHDKTNKPWDVFKGLVEIHHPPAGNLIQWIQTSQQNQLDALKFAIEHFRISGFCRGALIWQFNDCWPAQSWAVQDYARIVKPAGVELKRLFAPVILSIKPVENGNQIWISNESPQELSGVVSIDGVITEPFEVQIDPVPPGSSAMVAELPDEFIVEALIKGLDSSRTSSPVSLLSTDFS